MIIFFIYLHFNLFQYFYLVATTVTAETPIPEDEGELEITYDEAFWVENDKKIERRFQVKGLTLPINRTVKLSIFYFKSNSNIMNIIKVSRQTLTGIILQYVFFLRENLGLTERILLKL